jgi:parallel beta-helix repeat protein
MLKAIAFKVSLLIGLIILFEAAFDVPSTHGNTISSPQMDVTFGTTPTVNGIISAGEYTDANSITFETLGGTCTVYSKHNGTALYVAFDIPNVGGAVQVFLDTDHDQANLPQPDDYRLTIQQNEPPYDLRENQGTGSSWTTMHSPIGWSGAYQNLGSSWNAEFAIPYTKLGIVAGVMKTMGISFMNVWISGGDRKWPVGASWINPSTWGDVSSSDNWAPTIYVDHNGSCDGHTPCHTTIGAGINAASNGYTVYVYDGTYYENVTVDKSIDLVGEDREVTIIDGGGIGDVVRINTNGCNISNFTVVGTGSGGYDCGIEITSHDNVISNNLLISNQHGISVSSFGNRIMGNKCYNTNFYGVRLESSSRSSLVENNYFSDSAWPIMVFDSDSNDVIRNVIGPTCVTGIVLSGGSSHNSIQYNIIDSTSIAGIEFGTSCDSNVILGNVLTYCGGDGLSIETSQDNTISENSFIGNGSYGVILAYCEHNILYHNSFINNSLANAFDFDSPDTNVWDNGYPSGGNYWDDYAGVDQNGDGIGDTPYAVEGGSQDRYPLMKSWIRGDANGDSTIDIEDALCVLNYLFKGGPAPVPLDAGDCNCSGNVDLGDAIYLLNYLFKGGPAPGC